MAATTTAAAAAARGCLYRDVRGRAAGRGGTAGPSPMGHLPQARGSGPFDVAVISVLLPVGVDCTVSAACGAKRECVMADDCTVPREQPSTSAISCSPTSS